MSRVKLLHLLQNDPGQTTADLAEATGLHPNTIRGHVARLLAAGLICTHTEVPHSRGRPKVYYSAVTGVDTHSSPESRQRTQDAAVRSELARRVLRESPTFESPVVQRQIDVLEDHLDQSGFDAAVSADGEVLTIGPCPYVALVEEHPGIVCNVHLGVIRSVLAQAGGPVDAGGMLTLIPRENCSVHLDGAGTHSCQPGAR